MAAGTCSCTLVSFFVAVANVAFFAIVATVKKSLHCCYYIIVVVVVVEVYDVIGWGSGIDKSCCGLCVEYSHLVVG